MPRREKDSLPKSSNTESIATQNSPPQHRLTTPIQPQLSQFESNTKAKTFTLFPKLSAEIRQKIWSFAIPSGGSALWGSVKFTVYWPADFSKSAWSICGGKNFGIERVHLLICWRGLYDLGLLIEKMPRFTHWPTCRCFWCTITTGIYNMALD